MRSVIELPGTIERATNKLPVGRAPLLAFVADGETEKALHDCLSQLSIAHGEIMRGGIAKAVEFLGSQRSPNILIVDISGVALPVSQVHTLAEVCEPGLTVITIGNRNDVGLYRDLQQAGVTDYVAKPLTAQHLAKPLPPESHPGEADPLHQKLATTVA